jgi:hypothetical protein
LAARAHFDIYIYMIYMPRHTLRIFKDF